MHFNGGAAAFLDACDAVGTSLCGRWPVAAFMAVAEVGGQGWCLHWRKLRLTRAASLTRLAAVLQALGWTIELLSYAPSDLYVQSGNINGFAAFAAWGPADE